jgi:subtilisin family serine protease
MDPALEEVLLETQDPNEEVDALIRLKQENQIPPGVRVISRFGTIITGRVKRRNVEQVYRHPYLISFKAPRLFYTDLIVEEDSMPDDLFFETASPGNEELTGKGVLIGIIDWGGDFAHVDFVNSDGTTRFLALWDQAHTENSLSPQPFGYGKVYYRDRINAALRTSTPYRTLGYHPGSTDARRSGMHGTQVMGIAASNGRSGQKGIAPDADIVFVHLGTGNTDGQYNLGDSVSILEAIDFIKKQAGDRPLVINLSVGKHGGPHDGTTLVEMAIDNFLQSNKNTVLCQSTGNYFSSKAHCSGVIKPAETQSISFITGSSRIRENEVEIWYSGNDAFDITLRKKNTQLRFFCPPGSSANITNNNRVVGRIYHRRHDPNNGRNHVNIFLYPGAPLGEWVLDIEGVIITDGRFHAWIERADAGQSVFADAHIVRTSTTNTICNSYNAIVLGAYNQSDPAYPITSFSSSGPTFDGRIKPVFLAPGWQINAAKSSPPGQQQGGSQLVRMSGTSMAAPFATGVVARLLQGISRKASIHDVRNMLYKTCIQVPRTNLADQFRAGYGILDITKINSAVQWFNSRRSIASSKSEVKESIRKWDADSMDYSVEPDTVPLALEWSTC